MGIPPGDRKFDVWQYLFINKVWELESSRLNEVYGLLSQAGVRGCSMLGHHPGPKMGPRGWVWAAQVFLAQNLGGLGHFWKKGRFWPSGPWSPHWYPPPYFGCPHTKLGWNRVLGAFLGPLEPIKVFLWTLGSKRGVVAPSDRSQ